VTWIMTIQGYFKSGKPAIPRLSPLEELLLLMRDFPKALTPTIISGSLLCQFRGSRKCGVIILPDMTHSYDPHREGGVLTSAEGLLNFPPTQICEYSLSQSSSAKLFVVNPSSTTHDKSFAMGKVSKGKRNLPSLDVYQTTMINNRECSPPLLPEQVA
jgi:hypothetical protein